MTRLQESISGAVAKVVAEEIVAFVASLEADALSRKRVTLWDPETKKMIKGFAAPMQKNVEQYLRKHPNLVVYNTGQAQAAKPTHSGRSAPR